MPYSMIEAAVDRAYREDIKVWVTLTWAPSQRADSGVIRVEEIEDGEQEAEGRQQAERQVRSLMARTAYAADSEIQGYLFDEDADMDLYSAMQLTEIIGADFVAQADGDAEFYLEH